MPTIAENIAETRRRIKLAAMRAGRDPNEIELLVVTKAVDEAKAVEAVEAGVASLGESRVQEARRKYKTIGARAKWHMIGPLQTNKAKYCPGLFTLIHSVDRLDLIRELDRRSRSADVITEILLQVNISGESQKAGCRPEDTAQLLKEASGLLNIKVSGLMTVPPYNEDPEASRPYFKELVSLKNDLDAQGIDRVSLSEMSIGMTGDFEVAVEEGATIVRIGSAIFGKRVYN
ncbi:UPF0001 protein YggS [hydrothermal vent metagenome]|uniref:UPF0001 protein YggS n=1 Tax=hydrothermal vent metagenome TaxID=652676 RepID=A0A3B1CU89_9ZZZZ